ncbi:ATP-dependent protease ATPase subunit HslU [Metallibacterium sp.]|uniref:ATP-dependent protease ATPase subunit HslU n=1 Tax=Metallibacterium sp. TaxID=2940281 RepID=UPI0026175F55|nr:ATP-dependent protease ATPase subunit HslU [Metallibacterium sp.]
MSELTPREIVNALDKHIIGQHAAKRAVAIALRNRWRRMQLPEELREEITPKNILMIGPTGVGKTEIARRLASMADAPFLKIEATKFTEVGYVGKDVESIVRDLVDVAFKLVRARAAGRVQIRAEDQAEERLLDALLPRRGGWESQPGAADASADHDTRQKLRKQLREGTLDEREIELELTQGSGHAEILTPPGMEEMGQQLQQMFQSLGNPRAQRRTLKVREARRALIEEEAGKLLNEDDLRQQAVRSAEEQGIVFLDEIDKVAQRGGASGNTPGISREGVQRDLLPLVEGTTVPTKYGAVRTDHVLFIASGAFSLAKPSDLIPELQGRLPIRVELQALGVEDFERILTEPRHALTLQYQELLRTEGVALSFDASAVRRLAELAWQINSRTENIGARRLATVMERLLESISFEASDKSGEKYVIDAEYVDAHLADLAADEDLSRYIL